MSASAAFDPAAYMEHVLEIIQAQALNWHSIQETDFVARYRAAARSAADMGALHLLVRQALAELGDRHSHLIVRPSESGSSATVSAPEGRMVGGAGYLKIPAFSSRQFADQHVFAATLRHMIRTMEVSGPRGWIVDLRGNGGGNMWPVLRGLVPLLGDGPLGAFVASGRPTLVWSISDGRLLYDGKDADSGLPADALFAVGPAPIAVLTGRGTVSSGEAIAVAFRGWDRSRSFGQATFGLSTANHTFALADGSLLAITTSVFADRTGRVYGGPIEPDQPINGETVEGTDAVIAAALAWIEGVPAAYSPVPQR
jgi:C-terminal processing protease CtpA/Prc